jgi:hypothetical protein
MGSKIQLPMHFRDWNTLSAPPPIDVKREAKSIRPSYKRPCVIGIVSAIIVVLIIAVVVSLAVVLPKQGKAGRHASVILPLYIYPETNASWAPLFSSYVDVTSPIDQRRKINTKLDSRQDQI